MSLNEFFDIVWEYLDDQIKLNASLEEIKKLFFSLCNSREDYFVEVNSFIYFNHKELEEDDRINFIESENSNCLISIEFEDEKLMFSIIVDKVFNVTLKYSCENEYQEDIIIDLEIRDDYSIWQTIKEVYDERGYYHNFLVDVVAYDRNHKEDLIEECADRKLNVFGEFFGLTFEEAKKYINDFKSNKQFLNNAKMMLEMSILDDMFSLDYCKLVEPFNISDLKNKIISLEDGSEFENDINVNRVNDICKSLVDFIGLDGECTLSFNLLLNIVHYCMLETDVLYTNGIIIKKVGNKRIIYNINISMDGITVIPSETNREYLERLYYSADSNEEVPGLAEFFGFGNSRRLG